MLLNWDSPIEQKKDVYFNKNPTAKPPKKLMAGSPENGGGPAGKEDSYLEITMIFQVREISTDFFTPKTPHG